MLIFNFKLLGYLRLHYLNGFASNIRSGILCKQENIMSFKTNSNIRGFCKQTVGHSASAVGHIGVPLNQSSEKAVQLESSGGAR